MVNLQHRSLEKELLDADNIPFADIKKNMQELDTINRLLGGHAITLKGLKQFLPANKKQISICEVGCGGGDNLRAIVAYCGKNAIRIQASGIDIKAACISFAEERNKDFAATWICSDYKLVQFKEKPDVIFTSLFCHHFPEEELIYMLNWMRINSNLGFFVNDLHRHQLAYYSIKSLTALFSNSYLVKNDAPLSVARGFKKAEWLHMLRAAQIPNSTVCWKWAFRYLIIAKNER